MVQVNFRTDEEIKSGCEKVLKKMGLNLSSALNMFMAQVTNEHKIPFTPSEGKGNPVQQYIDKNGPKTSIERAKSILQEIEDEGVFYNITAEQIVKDIREDRDR